MSTLEVGRYQFLWEAEQAGTLPRFLGSVVRGGLGHVLRRMVCVTRLPECGGCLLRFQCAYPVLFEPYAPPDLSEDGRYARPPVPFVLRVPFGTRVRRSVEPGERMEFELVLVGRTTSYLPYYLLAFQELGRRGLGPRRQRFRLLEVRAWTPSGYVTVYTEGTRTLRTDIPPVPLRGLATSATLPDPRMVAVRFWTPVRLDLGGDLVYPVEFAHLIRALVQRIRALERAYGTCGLSPPPPADDVRRVSDRTRWVDLSRYSTRQRMEMRIGGAVGVVMYEGQDLRPFAPWLGLGEWIGVGKLTSMGLGHMEVVRP